MFIQKTNVEGLAIIEPCLLKVTRLLLRVFLTTGIRREGTQGEFRAGQYFNISVTIIMLRKLTVELVSWMKV